jgi:hypothetical protein
MTPFRRNLTIILASHAVAYGLGQVLVLVVDPLGFVPAHRVFVEPLGLGILYSAVWFAWQVGIAIGHVRDTVDDVRAMLARRRELRRRARLLDAYQPGAVRPTSLADYMTAANRAA